MPVLRGNWEDFLLLSPSPFMKSLMDTGPMGTGPQEKRTMATLHLFPGEESNWTVSPPVLIGKAKDERPCVPFFAKANTTQNCSTGDTGAQQLSRTRGDTERGRVPATLLQATKSGTGAAPCWTRRRTRPTVPGPQTRGCVLAVPSCGLVSAKAVQPVLALLTYLAFPGDKTKGAGRALQGWQEKRRHKPDLPMELMTQHRRAC